MMQRAILAAIVVGAFAGRAATIWIGRPEFVGWFNHSYYYWVQVRGLLEGGQLPYVDLPLIFYLYAGLTRLLQAVGLEQPTAIVNAARVIMSLAPALIAVPVYATLRRIQGPGRLSGWAWVLVTLSAFLPLTLTHLPELLQKNTLGLLWLAALLFAVHQALCGGALRWRVTAGVLLLLVALTHLGTLAVAGLLALSVALATLLSGEANRRRKGAAVVVAAGTLGVALLVLALLDPDALERVGYFVVGGVARSLVGVVIAPGSWGVRLAALAGILVPAILAWLLVAAWRKRSPGLHPGDRVFWLSCIFTVYLCVFPCFDLDVVPRLMVFVPLPLIVVLGYQLRCGPPVFTRATIVAAGLGCTLMLVGESVDLVMRYPEKEATEAELVKLRVDHALSGDDLVLTSYAVNPICNWFLGTRAGLITAFHRDDFQRYERVFVLNPQHGGRPAVPGRYRTPEERYRAMRQTIPVPSDVEPLGATRFLDFYELQELPADWEFDADGRWIGWSSRGDVFLTPVSGTPSRPSGPTF